MLSGLLHLLAGQAKEAACDLRRASMACNEAIGCSTCPRPRCTCPRPNGVAAGKTPLISPPNRPGPWRPGSARTTPCSTPWRNSPMCWPAAWTCSHRRIPAGTSWAGRYDCAASRWRRGGGQRGGGRVRADRHHRGRPRGQPRPEQEPGTARLPGQPGPGGRIPGCPAGGAVRRPPRRVFVLLPAAGRAEAAQGGPGRAGAGHPARDRPAQPAGPGGHGIAAPGGLLGQAAAAAGRGQAHLAAVRAADRRPRPLLPSVNSIWADERRQRLDELVASARLDAAEAAFAPGATSRPPSWPRRWRGPTPTGRQRGDC